MIRRNGSLSICTVMTKEQRSATVYTRKNHPPRRGPRVWPFERRFRRSLECDGLLKTRRNSPRYVIAVYFYNFSLSERTKLQVEAKLQREDYPVAPPQPKAEAMLPHSKLCNIKVPPSNTTTQNSP